MNNPDYRKLTEEELQSIKVGDTVTRLLAGELEQLLKVTNITEEKIICGDWEFHLKTGGEIDLYLGWDSVRLTGSVLGTKKESDGK